MDSNGYSVLDREQSAGSSYNDLYIYYLQGRLISSAIDFGRDFIGNWEEDGCSFLFFSEPSESKVKTLLSLHPQLTLLDKYHMTYDEWHGQTIAPFTSGSFLISPPWEKVALKKKLHHIVLDPGVVFGTGTHTTTKDCLEALELACSEERIESVVDLGTGTGILALAAGRLGCTSILAVDSNFLAARTAMKNIRLNRLEDKILVVRGQAEDFIDCHSGLVIANIHYGVMKHLLSSRGFLDKKWFILSGLLRSQARELVYKLSRYPVKIIKKWERDGIWHTFLGKLS